MPDIRDFLPQPPWEGPPIPRVFAASVLPARVIRHVDKAATFASGAKGCLREAAEEAKVMPADVRKKILDFQNEAEKLRERLCKFSEDLRLQFGFPEISRV